ncbi:right-handed parallel beta-helix repeat-containing protein [Prosthecobacter sp.]|uniref:right-handed parallel beta-helix repeat-containing protein n=1 Tax=Prosthecobacter sp. TaxID=1965333 RepID=UPI001D8E818D|nr:right-handed parallel beta-helix repeat-containing protein [Prosthecobacter sp.]MCB1275325.1 hypothetical protein [Prosthecobacter sp.]
MKSLQEIYDCFEKRTRISTLPATINSDGAYYLDADLVVNGAGASGLTLGAGVKKVVIDLGGRTLAGQVGTGHGIEASAVTGGTVAVRNGTIGGFGGDAIRAPTCRVIASEMEFFNLGGRCIACGDDSLLDQIVSKNAGGNAIEAGARLAASRVRLFGTQGKGITCLRDLKLTGCIFSGGQMTCTECPAGTMSAEDCEYANNLAKCITAGGAAQIIRTIFDGNQMECVECEEGTMSESTSTGNAGRVIVALKGVSIADSIFKGNTGASCVECEEGTMSSSSSSGNSGRVFVAQSALSVIDSIFKGNNGTACVECEQGNASVRGGIFKGNTGACIKAGKGVIITDTDIESGSATECVACEQGTMAAERCKITLVNAAAALRASAATSIKDSFIDASSSTAPSGPFVLNPGASLHVHSSTVVVSHIGLAAQVGSLISDSKISNGSAQPCPPGSWGDGCVFKDTEFTDIGCNVGKGCVIKNCTFINTSGDSYDAVTTEENSSVIECTITGMKAGQTFGGNGITVGANSLVKNCVVGSCDGHGIVIAARSSALQNVVCDCGTSVAATSAGIRCLAGPCTIDGNSTTQNDVGIDLAGTGTSVMRNKISLNTTDISGAAGNDVAPLATAATATSPFSNFQ